MLRKPPSPPRPEDATSYAEFVERLGSERAEEWRGVSSPAANLCWLVGVISFVIGFVLLLGAAMRPTSWSGWADGVAFAGVFLVLVVSAIWRGWRVHKRHELLDRLARRWRERAVNGEAPLSTAADPGQRSKEEWDMRAALAVRRDLTQADASVPAAPRPSARTLMYTSLGALGAGTLMLPVLVVAAALRAPVGVLVALVVAVPTLGVVGLILSALASMRSRAEHSRRMAVIGQMNAARLSMFWRREWKDRPLISMVRASPARLGFVPATRWRPVSGVIHSPPPPDTPPSSSRSAARRSAGTADGPPHPTPPPSATARARRAPP